MKMTRCAICCLRATAFGLCCIALLLVWVDPARAFEYNPRPDCIRNLTLTRSQKELYRIATGRLSDETADAHVQACQDLMADQAASPELKRWAALHEVYILMGTSREDQAVAAARRWLAANPNHMLAQRVRAKVAEMLVSRMPNENFRPTPAEAEAAYAEVFAHAWQEPLVTAEARSLHAAWMSTVLRRRDDAIAALDVAIAELQAYIESPVSVPAPLAEGMSLLERGEWLARDQDNRKWAPASLERLVRHRDKLANFGQQPGVREQIKRAREDTLRMIKEQSTATQAENSAPGQTGE